MSQTSVVFASQNENIYNDCINEDSCYEEVAIANIDESIVFITDDKKLSYNEVLSSLKSGKPIKIGISRNIAGQKPGSHATILCGTFIYLNDGKYYYVYRDSNEPGYIVNSIVESTRTTNTGTTFYFKLSNLYNNWNNSYVVYK